MPNEKYPLYRVAKVIDVADENELSEVKVKIFPELSEISDDLCPWAFPENQGDRGVMDGLGKHNPPELDSMIVVKIYKEDWKSIGYYETGYNIPGFNVFPKFAEEATFESEDEGDGHEYPQPHFRREKDGTFFYHNTDTGELGIYHPTGLYVMIQADGGVVIRNFTRVRIKKSDNLFFELTDDDKVHVVAPEMTFETDTFTIGDGGDDVALFTPLEEILTKLLEHTHVAPSGPTQPAQEANGTPLSASKAKVKEIASQKTSTD
jgi:hypothetical protein